MSEVVDKQVESRTDTNKVSDAGVLLDESGQLNSRPDLRFPHPTERPGSIVVIFDGKCRFCTSQVRILQRVDFAKRLSFISLHDPHVALWWPDLTYDQLMEQIFVIPPTESDAAIGDRPTGIGTGEHRYAGAEGFRYIAWRLPLLWPAALVLSLPFCMPIWKAMYDFIARQRYRFGKLGSENGCGPDGTCELHFGDKKKPS